MKSVIALSVSCLLLVASAAAAQTAAPKGAAPAPAQPAPAQPAQPTPTQPATPAPRPAPRPFPADAKVAYIDLNTVATTSREGQAAGVKIKDLQAKRTADLEGKQKQLQAAQQKLEQGGAVLSESARAQQTKEVERLQTELQRSSQDAQKEIQEFTQELQVQFQQKLLPIIEQVAKAKNLHLILSIADAGVVWVDSGLNVTADVVTALDAASGAK
jgi:outer membrane protein